MKQPNTRREFFAEVGKGMLVATVGAQLASELGLATTHAAEAADSALTFGALEPLVATMQETPPDKLLPILAERIKAGTSLRDLTAAAAFANARSFGGDDYVGFHTMAALSPALRMSGEMTGPRAALPVMKVLYRNTNRIQENGGRAKEVLRAIAAEPGNLREFIHATDTAKAERALAARAANSPEDALNDLLMAVQDSGDVHRVVIPYRAWDLMDLIGREHALTMLRQSVRYCVRGENWANRSPYNEPRTLIPNLLEKHALLDRKPGDKQPDDAWIDALSKTFFTSSASDAAEAAASALAEGFTPAAIGEAISLAANQLVLRDHGRTPREESPGKGVGSVHGDSIGVHASDAANAWRNLARVSNSRNTFACLIIGAWQVAKDRTDRGGDFQNWEPLPVKYQFDAVKSTDPAALLRELDGAIRGNMQARAAAIAARYGALDLDPKAIFATLRDFSISEDGALHAEKYYQTVREDFASSRQSFRWRHVIGLARVAASEFGKPAPGMAQAVELIGAKG